MKAPASLRLRLMAAALATISLALVLAGFGLAYLFEQHVERRVASELDNHLVQMIVSFGAGTAPTAASSKIALSDPRFRSPYSGLYWQINDASGVVARSRSLWDFELDFSDATALENGTQEYSVPGPDNTQLVTLTRTVIPQGGQAKSYRFMVALDHGEVSKAVAAFAWDLGASLVVLAVVLMAAAWAQVSIGLLPLDRLRRQVLGVRAGQAERIGGGHPTEVLPLTEEINTLLDHQEEAMDRARAHAGNLAHGLKTPLTVLGAESRRLQTGGAPGVAAEINAQISTMNRHIERELARSRIRGARLAGRSRAELGLVIDEVVRTLRRLPRGEAIAWDSQVPSGQEVQVDADDLAEILGNLLDNARKWASGKVAVSSVARQDDWLDLRIADDGPGVPPGDYERVLRRGQRLDETVQGSGLGLAIAQDILEAYDGKLRLDASKLGGLEIIVTLPCAQQRQQ